MDKALYPMIFKRKSFHIFKDIGRITEEELQLIDDKINKLSPLVKDIKTEIRIVPSNKTSCKRGQEYCILFYSENKDNYLQNIGYIGEQLDLFLASLNIGALWFGIGKVNETSYNGLDFVIMIAIAKVEENKFRKDMYKSKRKSLDEIWNGSFHRDIGNIVRFTPSACNTQPWLVESTKEKLTVYRYKKYGKRGIMPASKVVYYNRIDIGIFLCFLDLCLQQNQIDFNRTIYIDLNDDEAEKTITAVYSLTTNSETEN